MRTILKFPGAEVIIDKKTLILNGSKFMIRVVNNYIDHAEKMNISQRSFGCITLTLEEAKLIQKTYYEINPKT